MPSLYRPPDIVKVVRKVRFHLCDESDIKQLSHAHVYKALLYSETEGQRKPASSGLLDPRLGATKRDELCATCGLDYQTCIGHWGYFDLPVPVYHGGYFTHITKILQSICKTCSRVLLTAAQKQRYLVSCSNPNLEYVQKKMLRRAIHKLASKTHTCPHCFSLNGVITKGSSPSHIIHDIFRHAKSKIDAYLDEYSHVIAQNPDLLALLRKGLEIIRPAKALQLFTKIPEEDLPLLLMPTRTSDNYLSHPQNLIIRRIPVAPNAIRPSVVSEVRSGTNEDDLTHIYQWLLAQATTVDDGISEAEHITCVDSLHYEFTRLLNSQQSSLPPVHDHKFMRGLLQRLSGKHGRFRGNLLGKRTNFTARTVISPDPNMRIDELCVPIHCAKILTYPDRVTDFNIEFLRQRILNGPDTHPGALFVTYRLRGAANQDKRQQGVASDQVKRFLGSAKARSDVASHLQTGDLVERHLTDGDIVLFNRQPSLHRVSFQAFKSLHNIVSSKCGEPLTAPIQDIITASHLLTLKDVFFTRDQFCQLASQLVAGNHVGRPLALPTPAIVWPTRLWTGKQLFGLVISPHPSTNIKLNLRCPTKSLYSSKGEEMCPNDGFVLIRNSELLAGSLDKKLLGGGSKSTVFYRLLRDYGPEACADAMWRLSRIVLFYLAHRGFSIGIGEVKPGKELIASKAQLIGSGFAACGDFIRQYEGNTLPCSPGCSMEDTLEANLSQELSKIREEAGTACKRQLHPSNAPLVMAQCGSKGSFLNISQMIACVGQQIIGGHRVADSINGRSLIHFPRGSRFPEAKGFVGNSFYSGLTPSEFFFHAMSGREGLTDTAVKTADTGYMQRRLIKFLEDLTVAYDNTVRDSRGDIIQFRYGSDGFDPIEMEVDDFPVDLDRELTNLKLCNPCLDEPAMTSSEVSLAVATALQLDSFACLDSTFHNHVNTYIAERLVPALDTWSNFLASADPSLLGPLQGTGDRITRTQLRLFLTNAKEKFERALIEPGTAIGALCGQSIGEPATQMTLKTFHFAGVASMNITQGVPRMREIINAAVKIHTPLISVTLADPFSTSLARRVKLAIEPTRLGDVAISLRQCLTPDDVFVAVKLDEKRLARRGLTAGQIARSIQRAKLRAKVKVTRVTYSSDVICVYTSDLNALESVVKAIEEVVVKGISGVSRVVIQQGKDGEHRIFVEGAKLREVMCVEGVVPELTQSNNIVEIEQVLGIEAARRVVISELLSVMEGHGVDVNVRHVMLLADVMTSRGEVCGYQRTGMAKAKNSVFCLASFERTGDHLFEAAYHSQDDSLTGVTEGIILGNPTQIGTGVFDLLTDNWKNDVSLTKKTTLLE